MRMTKTKTPIKKAKQEAYHTKNGHVLKGWLLQTSNPHKKVDWRPYKGKKDIRRGITPAEAWWWLFSKKEEALGAKKQLLADKHNETMKVKLQYRQRLRQNTYYY